MTAKQSAYSIGKYASGQRFKIIEHRPGAITLTKHVTVVESEEHGVWLRIDDVDIKLDSGTLEWLGRAHLDAWLLPPDDERHD